MNCTVDAETVTGYQMQKAGCIYVEFFFTGAMTL